MKKYIIGLLVALLAVTGVVAYSYWQNASDSIPTASAAAVDYFLKIEGIDGESTDTGHRNEIDVESWSWGETNTGTRAGGGGGGAGKVSMQDFHFVMKTSKASPKLMLAVATGKHFPEAVLTVRKAGGAQQLEYIKIKMSDVLISSYQIGGSGDNIPTDQISISFSKFEFEYIPQNPDGTPGTPEKAGWDLGKNKAI